MPGPFFWFVAIIGSRHSGDGHRLRDSAPRSGHSPSSGRSPAATQGPADSRRFRRGMANGLVFLNRALERAADAEASARVWRTFIGALAESPAPLVLGFALLAVTWLLVAAGLRRQA